MKRTVAAVWSFFACAAYAGFGGMANIEEDNGGGSSESFGLVTACAVVGAVAGYFYCAYRNKSSSEKLAPDGGAIIGFFVGGIVLPFVWISFNR